MAEFLLYAGISIAVLTLTGQRHLRASSPVAWTAVGCAILLPLGQSSRDHSFYPFDHWGMYGSLRVPERVPKYFIRNSGGQVYEYPFGDLAFSSPRAFIGKIDQLVSRCGCDRGDPQTDELIAALALIHSRRRGVGVEAFWVEEASVTNGNREVMYVWPPSARQD